MPGTTKEAGGPPAGAIESMDRRQLLDHLKATGAGALALAISGGGALGTLLGAGHALAAPTAPAASTTRKFRYGMVIDTRRCVGCKACVAACKAENKTPPGVSYNRVEEYALGAHPLDRPLFTTRPCNHCDDPPCVPACPVDATFKREQDGIVVVDYDKCDGLGLCVEACPYGMRNMDKGANYPSVAAGTAFARVPSPEYGQFRKREPNKAPIGKVRKCTFCVHLQDDAGKYDKNAGRWPACAKTCTGKAIYFGDLDKPEGDLATVLSGRSLVRLNEDAGTEPNVYYAV